MLQRVVIVDPGHRSSTGHHAEVNHHLVGALRQAGLAVECWLDEAAIPPAGPYRPVFDRCGYEDPRHWLDLPGCLHLARRLREQIDAAVGPEPVVLWIAHSLLPFQLMGLAQALQSQPPARVEIGILYAPAERLGGSTEPTAVSPGPLRERQLAIANAQVAWSALAQAVQRAGHQLRIGCASRTQAALHQPLLASAGLPAPCLQPAVVGAGRPLAPPVGPSAQHAPQVLLHWGDLKADKGRQAVMDLLAALLASPPSQPDPPRRWLFHGFSEGVLSAAELQLLQRAERELPGFSWLQGAIPTPTMQRHLADCDLALLPYDPVAYGERSSGVLWCYGAARRAAGLPAAVVGYRDGWLSAEATAFGMGFQGLMPGSYSGIEWLQAVRAAPPAPQPAAGDSYASQVLECTYADWVLAGLDSA